MKKNYLLVTLMGALVLSGCNGNSTSSSSAAVSSSSVAVSTSSSTVVSSSTSSSTTISSSTSSSSSSSEKALATVYDAVEKLAFDYTVNYTNANEENYSVFVEDTDYNEVILFFESTNDGYYFDAQNDAYYYYMNGSNQPIYNSVGKITSEDAVALKTLIDVKSAYEGASWDLVSEGKEIVYYTEDAEVMAVSSFLTESEVLVSSVEVSIKATSSSTKLVGFTTYDENGDVLATADFKRLGTTYATDSMPLLNDDIDPTLEGMWYVAQTSAETLLGEGGSFFDVYIYDDASYLVEYAITPVEGGGVQLSVADVFEYATPSGYGTYYFYNEADDLVELASANGALIDENGDLMYNTGCIFATKSNSTGEVAQGVAISYYEISLISAVYAYNEDNAENPEVTTTYKIQILQPYEEEYASFVSELGGIGAYYISELDAEGNEVDAVIFTQWATIDDLIVSLNGLMTGGFDSTFYNGCALGSYVYATFFMVASATEESINMLFNISTYLDPVYAEVDVTKYPTPVEGQSEKDYIVSAMESLGYISNSESFVLDGTDYVALIKDVNTSEEAGITCTDVIFFEGADGSYGCILVIDNNGDVFVTTIGFGYFAVIINY